MMRLRLNVRLVPGFSLLELLVVIVIIGLLAGLVAPRYFRSLEYSKIHVARAQINILDQGVGQFRLDTGRLPTAGEGLAVLMTPPSGLDGWKGPYLKQLPQDPWNHPFMYEVPGRAGRDFDVVSYGEDGAFGGIGAAADIDVN